MTLDAAEPLQDVKEAWEAKEAYAIKFGGDNACDVQENCRYIKQQAKGGRKYFVTVSALRNNQEEKTARYRHETVIPDKERRNSFGFNTTDHLNAAAKALADGNIDTAVEIVDCIEAFTIDTVKENIGQVRNVDVEAVLDVIRSMCEALRATLKEFNPDRDEVFGKGRDKIMRLNGDFMSLTSFGESLAGVIYNTYFGLKYSSLKATEINLVSLLSGLERTKDGNNLRVNTAKERSVTVNMALTDMMEKTAGKVLDAIDDNDVVFAGGYLPVAALKLGYADLVSMIVGTAALEKLDTGKAIRKRIALMSGDPEILKTFGLEPKLLSNVNYHFGLNLMDESMANTGVVESLAMRLASAKKIDIFVIGDDGSMSRIHDFEAAPGPIENITLKPVTHVSINVKDDFAADPETVGAAVHFWEYKNELQTTRRHVGPKAVYSDIVGDVTPDHLADLKAIVKRQTGLELEIQSHSDDAALYCLGNNMDISGLAGTVMDVFTALGLSNDRFDQGDPTAMLYYVSRDKAKLVSAALYKVCIEKSPEELAAYLGEGGTIGDLISPLIATDIERRKTSF